MTRAVADPALALAVRKRGQLSGASQSRWQDFVQLSGSIETDDNILCDLRANGTVRCWGDDSQDQVSGVNGLGR